MKILLLFFLFLNLTWAQDVSLLNQQLVLSQMTGNCYTHSGTDMMTGAYLRNKRLVSTIQPHPILLGGLVSADTGRGNISSGLTCDFFNAAKKIKKPVCSVQAYNYYVAKSGATTKKVRDNINSLDRSMQTLHKLFQKNNWSRADKALALKSADIIIGSTCHLQSVANLDDRRFVELVDDAREIISRLAPRRSFMGGLKEDLIDMFTEGVGPYTFRRIEESHKLNKDRKSVMNEMLEEIYISMNDQCVAYARKNKLSVVPSDFLNFSKPYTCHNEIYKVPRIKGEKLKSTLNFIDRQVRAGYPTGVYLCSAVFYGKGPKVGDYRDSTGECVNGGGHAVTVTGIVYRNGKRFFKIRNSWGTGSCHTLAAGKKAYLAKKRSGCPSDNAITCEDGVYYMSDDYLGLGLWGHARLTVMKKK